MCRPCSVTHIYYEDPGIATHLKFLIWLLRILGPGSRLLGHSAVQSTSLPLTVNSMLTSSFAEVFDFMQVANINLTLLKTSKS